MTNEEAIKTLKEHCACCAYGVSNMDACDISYCDVREAVQTLERTKSKWIEEIDCGNVPHYICPVCGERRNGKPNFCPKCGADMRESEDT